MEGCRWSREGWVLSGRSANSLLHDKRNGLSQRHNNANTHRARAYQLLFLRLQQERMLRIYIYIYTRIIRHMLFISRLYMSSVRAVDEVRLESHVVPVLSKLGKGGVKCVSVPVYRIAPRCAHVRAVGGGAGRGGAGQGGGWRGASHDG